MTAAQLAKILDPDYEVAEWWRHIYRDHFKYTGPPDLHIAREHDWRKEDWLEARGYCWFREEFPHSKTWKTQVYRRLPRTSDHDPSHELVCDPQINHSAALLDAVEEIAQANK